MDGRRPADNLLRRLRSHLPVSPLPWQWNRWIGRGLIAAVAALLIAGAAASILLQGDSSSGGDSAPGIEAPRRVRALLASLSLPEKVDQVVAGYAGPGDPGEVPPLRIAAQSGPWSAGSASGLEQRGFDLVLGPVADVSTPVSPDAELSFGDDPAAVARNTAAAVRSCRDAGIACAVSHFPGLGGASADPTDEPATVSLDAASLATRDLLPFRAAFAAGAPAVVLSLAQYAAYDPVTPGALSPAVATSLLRDRMRFDGVALTDDLSSGAIEAGVGAPDAAVQAIAAGVDLALVSDPAELAMARASLIDAARAGAISADRLNQAVARVLTLKRRINLLR
jgi:Glycosyl hydrolase family 3 N terminal domain